MVIEEIKVSSIIDYVNNCKIKSINNDYKNCFCYFYDYIYLFEDNFIEKININAALKIFIGENERKEKYLLINNYFKNKIKIKNNMILFEEDIFIRQKIIHNVKLLALLEPEDSVKLNFLLTV